VNLVQVAARTTVSVAGSLETEAEVGNQSHGSSLLRPAPVGAMLCRDPNSHVKADLLEEGNGEGDALESMTNNGQALQLYFCLRQETMQARMAPIGGLRDGGT
jgi:hypothetical protein